MHSFGASTVVHEFEDVFYGSYAEVPHYAFGSGAMFDDMFFILNLPRRAEPLLNTDELPKVLPPSFM